MNEQLTLISNEYLTATAQKKSEFAFKQPKNARLKANSRYRSSNNSQVWWKLSQEEKELGLAGVRSIRSILQKYVPNDDSTIAKAS